MKNQYDIEILEYAPNASKIIEVIREKKMSAIEQVMDIVGDFVLSLTDSFKIKGAYYLVVQGDKIELVLVKKKTFEKEIWDVTTEVNASKNPKKFVYEENYYKVVRNVL